MLFLVALVLMVVAFVVALLFRRNALTPMGSDPLCGQCGYCVRGLEGIICPECGGDLNVVGTLQPGTRGPLGRGKRLLVWTLAVPFPALFVVFLALHLIGPQWLFTTQRRVIFSQST